MAKVKPVLSNGGSRTRKHKTRIHVNQHAIKANKKNGTNLPVITVKTYKTNRYAYGVRILGPSKVVYQPDCPLSCGARVWIETEAKVEVE